jgi:hypothetical protein
MISVCPFFFFFSYSSPFLEHFRQFPDLPTTTKNDNEDFIERTTMDRARRGRLIDDFEKDELEKLNYIRKEFTQEFRMTEEDYDNDVIEFDGTLEQFYNHCLRTYTKKLRSLKKRGRPRKL